MHGRTRRVQELACTVSSASTIFLRMNDLIRRLNMPINENIPSLPHWRSRGKVFHAQ